MSSLKLGSLFDGSGGFPLAGVLCGIEPVWASEIEPFPIKVTTMRFPYMKHYGNVCEMDGAKVEPVDIITFGSPCQDLSQAGSRAGLEGRRSNLFYQAIRIIKEMREASDGKYPRFAVWENVPGAFTSNKGNDLFEVVREFTQVGQAGISIPRLKNWKESGLILADNFSLAWRQLDAQFWGVPQRRKRIFLVCDFNGQSAKEILFKSESVSGYYRAVQKAWENLTQRTISGSKKSSGQIDKKLYENHSQDSRYKEKEINPAVTAAYGTGGNNQPLIREKSCCDFYNYEMQKDDKSIPLTTQNAGTQLNSVMVKNNAQLYRNHGQTDDYDRLDDVADTVCATYGMGGSTKPYVLNLAHNFGDYEVEEGKSPTITASHSRDMAVNVPSYSICGNQINRKHKNGGNGHPVNKDVSFTLTATDVHAVSKNQAIVRRLTPKECARLQGFPDYWCECTEIENPSDKQMDFWRKVFYIYSQVNNQKMEKTNTQIKKWLARKNNDSAEYKMWGNGVVLPCVLRVIAGIAEMMTNYKEGKSE